MVAEMVIFCAKAVSTKFKSALFAGKEFYSKVEKVLKGSLDLIPSPSAKIQITGGKVCLRGKGKTLLGVVKKSLLTSPSNVLPYYLK